MENLDNEQILEDDDFLKEAIKDKNVIVEIIEDDE